MSTNRQPHPVLAAAHRAWNSCSELRQRRSRLKDFTYGRQWGELMQTPDGNVMTEGDYARSNGRVPLTNNLIRQIVKSVTGRFRQRMADEKPRHGAMRAIAASNQLDELDARLMEEFLISGCAVQKVTLRQEHPGASPRVRVDNLSIASLFVNRFRDPRGTDIELIGELHDMSLTEVLMRYGHGDPAHMADIRRAYNGDRRGVAVIPHLPFGEVGDPQQESAFGDAGAGRCRVIEVWTLESREVMRIHDHATAELYLLDACGAAEAESEARRRTLEQEPPLECRRDMLLQWRFRVFAPDGTLLDEGDSPYAHGSHPYAVKLYPLTDGEVHPFVEDIVDQQRHVNRLITLIDHIMGHSAKGVLLFPEEAMSEGMNWDDVTRDWAKVNGVIGYRGTFGVKPEQIVGNGSDVGAHRLIELEMGLLDRISGAGSAWRGEAASASEGTAHFESRLASANLSMLDIFATFDSLRLERDRKIEGCLPKNP